MPRREPPLDASEDDAPATGARHGDPGVAGDGAEMELVAGEKTIVRGPLPAIDDRRDHPDHVDQGVPLAARLAAP